MRRRDIVVSCASGGSEMGAGGRERLGTFRRVTERNTRTTATNAPVCERCDGGNINGEASKWTSALQRVFEDLTTGGRCLTPCRPIAEGGLVDVPNILESATTAVHPQIFNNRQHRPDISRLKVRSHPVCFDRDDYVQYLIQRGPRTQRAISHTDSSRCSW